MCNTRTERDNDTSSLMSGDDGKTWLYIRPVAKELNIDLGGWHDFRHTVAASMLRAGHGVKVVSELLGHSDVSITLRTYDHVESDAFRAPLNEAANQLL